MSQFFLKISKRNLLKKDIEYKTNMVDSHTSLTFAQAFDDTEKELQNNLPPWEKANLSQKLMILAIKTIILFPVLVVLGLVLSMYAIYIIFYIVPLVSDKSDLPEVYYWHTDSEHTGAIVRGVIFSILITWNIFWLLISLYKASKTDPGTIPRVAEWEIIAEDSSESSAEKATLEKRKDGSLRTCNHCQLRKPDRCHHCKQCDRCNLKMDHHCNWIANCVGNNNYKYFFLVVFYSALSLALFIGSFWEAIVVTLCDDENSEIKSLFMVTSYSLMVLLSIAVIGFFFFHVWLISKNFTTIEFCEKKRGKVPNFEKSPYGVSVLGNFKEALGNRPYLWMFPFDFEKSKDSGIYFMGKSA